MITTNDCLIIQQLTKYPQFRRGPEIRDSAKIGDWNAPQWRGMDTWHSLHKLKALGLVKKSKQGSTTFWALA